VAKKKAPADVVEKGHDLFSFLNAIYTDQSTEFFDTLSDSDRKKYHNSRYMLHRFLSMNPHYAPIVNELQKYTAIPDRAHYLFLVSLLPKGKQYHKYIKGAKDDKYEPWLVALVVTHYLVSKVEAIKYLDIYYEQDKAALRELCALYGVDKKQLKQAKL